MYVDFLSVYTCTVCTCVTKSGTSEEWLLISAHLYCIHVWPCKVLTGGAGRPGCTPSLLDCQPEFLALTLLPHCKYSARTSKS
jgi:hypothetical protein